MSHTIPEDEDQAFFEGLGRLIYEEDKALTVPVKEREDDVKAVFHDVKLIVRGGLDSNVKFSMKLRETSNSTGCISMEGKRIVVTDTHAFAVGCMLADGILVYPKTNGDVRFSFTFYGLSKKGDSV